MNELSVHQIREYLTVKNKYDCLVKADYIESIENNQKQYRLFPCVIKDVVDNMNGKYTFYFSIVNDIENQSKLYVYQYGGYSLPFYKYPNSLTKKFALDGYIILYDEITTGIYMKK